MVEKTGDIDAINGVLRAKVGLERGGYTFVEFTLENPIAATNEIRLIIAFIVSILNVTWDGWMTGTTEAPPDKSYYHLMPEMDYQGW